MRSVLVTHHNIGLFVSFLWSFSFSLFPKINFYCGIFLLACISVDRYLSIVHAAQMFSRKKAWLVHSSCLSVWLLSLLLSIPDWVFLQAVKDERRGDKTECIRDYMLFSQSTTEWRLHGLPSALPHRGLPAAVSSCPDLLYTQEFFCNCNVAPRVSRSRGLSGSSLPWWWSSSSAGHHTTSPSWWTQFNPTSPCPVTTT